MYDQWHWGTRAMHRWKKSQWYEVRADQLPFETAIQTQNFIDQPTAFVDHWLPVQPNKAIVGRNAFAHEAEYISTV